MIYRSPLNIFDAGRARKARAFSLVEVALALGLVSFALVSVMGLLPAGLRIHKDTIERQRAWETLQQATVAVTSQHTDTNNNFFFSDWLTADASNPITWKPGGAEQSIVLEVLENGDIRQATTPASDTTRQKLRVQVLAPSTLAGTTIAQSPATVKISVAWPASARWMGDKWENAAGSVDTVLYAPAR